MSSKVYIMSNKAMPGLVKIGWTSKNDVEQRRKELSNTSVPYPFVVEATYDVYVDSADKIIHQWFPRELRVNDNREFFNITVDYAKKVIEDYRDKGRVFWSGDEVGLDSDLDSNVNESDDKHRKTHGYHGGLESLIGKKLTWKDDPTIECEVVDAHHVKYDGQICSFIGATGDVCQKLYSKIHVNGYRPRDSWMYEGKSIATIFNN